MNSVILIGNLTRDPELRYSTGASQTAICRFTVAVNDRRRNPQTQEWEDNPSFIPIVVFGKQAENCDRYLAKGRKVAVNGRIQTGSYEKDGRTIYTTEVIASNVEFLGGGQQGQGGGYGQQQGGYGQQGFGQQSQGGFPPQQAPAPQQAPQGGQEIGAPGDVFTSLQDDDIPF